MTVKKLFLSVVTVVIFSFVSTGWIYGDMPGKSNRQVKAVAPDQARPPFVLRAEIQFPGGGRAWYVTDEATGCIRSFYFYNPETRKNEVIEPMDQHPAWLAKDRKIFDFGSLTDSNCRQGVIAVNSCPIQYFYSTPGQIFCIGAWDWAHGKWYQPCRSSYPPCP